MAAATLRSFQNEIDEIHTREVARQRATGAATVDKDKENKMPKGKAKEESISTPKPDAPAAEEAQTNMQEVEDRILVRHIPAIIFTQAGSLTYHRVFFSRRPLQIMMLRETKSQL